MLRVLLFASGYDLSCLFRAVGALVSGRPRSVGKVTNFPGNAS